MTITETTPSRITELEQHNLVLKVKYATLERKITDAIIHAVEVDGRMTKYLAQDLFDNIGIEAPTVATELTITVTASATFEPEIELDEEDVRDQIDSALYDEIESDWNIKSRYTSGLTGIEVTVEIEKAVRTITTTAHLPWGVATGSSEYNDIVEDVIRDEIGDMWDVSGWEVVESRIVPVGLSEVTSTKEAGEETKDV